VDYVYLRADGIHVNIRLEEHKLCLLVLIGVRADGRKELIALADGYRESAESWADLLRDCARRGMRAPVLAVGDGARGFWGALREVFPQAREGRCWFHKTANVLAALPKSAHPGARKALAEIWGAEDKAHALDAVTAFKAAYGAKFPKAVAKITGDLDQLLAFYDYPAEHWVPLRTTNPIESTRQPKTGGAPSTHLTWSPWSAPERLSSTENSSSGRERTPSPKPPKDLDPQVLTIARSSGPVVMASTGKSALPGEVITGPVPRNPATGTTAPSRFGDVKAGRAVQPVSRRDQTRPRRNRCSGRGMCTT
jgi:hypothetical protein